MMDSMTFRSSIGGFNREDVLQYVKELLDQNEALSEHVTELEKDLAARDAQLTEKDATIARLESECRMLRDGQNDVRQLGAAMFEARRFSDQLIEEANEKISAMMVNASGTAGRLDEAVLAMLALLQSTSGAIATSIEEVRGELNGLRGQIAGFETEIENEQEAFRDKYLTTGAPQQAAGPEAEEEPEAAPARKAQPVAAPKKKAQPIAMSARKAQPAAVPEYDGQPEADEEAPAPAKGIPFSSNAYNAAQPAVQPAVQPAAQPAAKPAAQPAAQPAAKRAQVVIARGKRPKN